MYRLERRQQVPRPRSEVFAFFSDPANLEALTPLFLGFQILTPPPIEMRAGAHIDYRIRLHGVPLTWRTLIERYEPEHEFVDVQVRGPYRTWRHLHELVELGDHTEIRDTIDYALPLGPLGRLAHAAFVRRQLRTIFDYRARVIAQRFGAPALGRTSASA